MTITNSVKRFAAAALAVIMVAGAAPAALGGGVKLFDTAIVASADSSTITVVSTADELSAALNDSSVSFIRFADDIAIDYIIYFNRDLTIDLNGFTLSYSQSQWIEFPGDCKVTIQNGTISNAKGRGYFYGGANVNLTLKDLNLYSTSSGVYIYNRASSVTVDNVYYNSVNGYSFVWQDNMATVNGTTRDTPVTTFTRTVVKAQLDKTEMELTYGESDTVSVTLIPTDAENKRLTVLVGDTDIADYEFDQNDPNGIIVTGKKVGTTTITFTGDNWTDTTDDDVSAVLTVTVNKADSTVTTAPTANELTYNGNGQDLVTAGKAEGGTLVYALGESADTAPEADAFFENIPGGTDPGTYYVWYKVIGDANHNDTKPVCVEVSIADKKIDISEGTVTVDTEKKTVTVKADGETVPESEYHVIYFTYEEIEGGESLTRVGTDFPTEPGTYIAGIVANEDSTLYIGENRSEPFTIKAPEESSEDESTPEESKPESTPEESKPDSTPAPAPVDQNQGTNPATGAAAGMGLAALAAAAAVVIKKKNK